MDKGVIIIGLCMTGVGMFFVGGLIWSDITNKIMYERCLGLGCAVGDPSVILHSLLFFIPAVGLLISGVWVTVYGFKQISVISGTRY